MVYNDCGNRSDAVSEKPQFSGSGGGTRTPDTRIMIPVVSDENQSLAGKQASETPHMNQIVGRGGVNENSLAGVLNAEAVVLCEFSATVRDALRARGVNAWSIDLLPTEGDPRWHYQGDVSQILGLKRMGYRNCDKRWPLVISHAPCTFLANSGAKHLYVGMKKENGPNAERWAAMYGAARFYVECLDAPAYHSAAENPVMHGPGREAVEFYWKARHPHIPLPAVHYIQPHQHGHGETKATGFRCINLPPLAPSNQVDGREQRIWKMAPSPDRWKNRSRTFPGVAEAIATQWGNMRLPLTTKDTPHAS